MILCPSSVPTRDCIGLSLIIILTSREAFHEFAWVTMLFLLSQYIHVFLNEVTILVEVLNDSKHSFALYTPERTKQRWPIRLAAATEQEMHDWVTANLVIS